MAEIKRCCICGHIIVGDGSDPSPLIDNNFDKRKVCCDYCYATKVVPWAVRALDRPRSFGVFLDVRELPDGKLYIEDFVINKSTDLTEVEPIDVDI